MELYIQQKADEIERMQEELNEYKEKLNDHSNDTEIFQKALWGRIHKYWKKAHTTEFWDELTSIS